MLLDLAGRYPTWDQLAAVAVPPRLPSAPQPEQDPT
jgi:exodeoxyribonuclease X